MQAEISLYNLTQCSTRLVFISADIIPVKEKKKKVEKICQRIKVIRYFVYLSHICIIVQVVRPQSA